MLKKTLTVGLLISASFLSVTAMAANGQYWDNKGDRIENRLDNKGDRINERLDRRSEVAQANGNFRRAENLDRKGDRINHRLDRRGNRINDRLDKRAAHVGARQQRRG